MRILVTGSRDWTDITTLREAILEASGDDILATIVHGGCPTGADDWADRVALAYEFIREVHPAQWRPYGIYNPQAGLARNREMVELGADICLAFIKNGSRGASHCAGLAEAAGIPTRRFIA